MKEYFKDCLALYKKHWKNILKLMAIIIAIEGMFYAIALNMDRINFFFSKIKNAIKGIKYRELENGLDPEEKDEETKEDDGPIITSF